MYCFRSGFKMQNKEPRIPVMLLYPSLLCKLRFLHGIKHILLVVCLVTLTLTLTWATWGSTHFGGSVSNSGTNLWWMTQIPHSQTDSSVSLLPSALMSFTKHEKIMLHPSELQYLIWLFNGSGSVPVSVLKKGGKNNQMDHWTWLS